MDTYIIYKHTNTVTGKSYIGLTKYSIERRFKQHLYDSGKCRNGKLPQSAFPRALRKYGK